MSDGDYLLGTRDDEIARLGLQHRVWRAQMLEGFRGARFAPGQTILDIGAGPGFATADLADTVGPEGKVIAFERSPNFLAALRARALPNVDVRDADVAEQELGEGIADGAWTRWLLAFLSDPARTVAHIARALKPGGVALFHEYLDYEAWRLIPRNEEQLRYRGLLIKSWRDSGGEPDAALELPRHLAAAGLELVEIRPMVEIITADDPWWQWPASFIASNAHRLHELGYCSADEANSFATILDRAPPGTRMLTPVVAEIIARKA
jgi:SAM-dependent methyltransferase